MLCRIGKQYCALPLTHVAETLRPLPVRQVPGRPAFMSGLSLVRGAPLPVVNGAALIGEPTSLAPAAFITLQAGSRQAVLAVQEMIGIRAMGADLLDGLEPLLAHVQGDTVAALAALDSEFLWLLDAAKLVPGEIAPVEERDEVPA